MSGRREFSASYLEQAGRPSVELIADAMAARAFDRVAELIAGFHTEVCTMLYGYLAWPKCVAGRVRAWQGEDYWRAMDEAVRKMLAEEPTPARELFPRWEADKAAMVDALQRRDADGVCRLGRLWHTQALAVHDSYMHYAAVLISELSRRFGPDAMQQVLTDIMDPEAMDMNPDTHFRQRVETLIKFTRLHLLPFKLIEDDEKVTFIATPCPSGGRQILAGLYQQDNPGEIIQGESPITYKRESLPAYCCHESALEAASIRRFGAPLFIVDPSAQLGHRPCHVHVYKDVTKIPDRYYHRVGLRREDHVIASG